MSTIYKISKSPYWYANLNINGYRKRISLKTKDKKLAYAKLRVLLSQNVEYKFIKKITLDDFINEFLTYASPPRYSKGHYQNFKSVCNRLKKELNINYLDQLSIHKANEFINNLSKNNISKRGLNWYIRTLRVIFNYALNSKYIDENPFNKIKKFNEPQIRPRIFNKEEINRFFKYLIDYKPELFYLILFYALTGLRRSEAINLQWNDIDFEKNIIHVIGKNGKYRIVPLMSTAKNILIKRRTLNKPFNIAASTISHTFNKICKMAEIKDGKLHDLRKTFASMLTDYGISESFVQLWLGHSSPDITRKYYIGFTDEMLIEKMENFEKSINLIPKKV